MKERMLSIFNGVKSRWGRLSRNQKVGIYSLLGGLLALLLIVIGLSSYKHYVPLYSNLSINEAGQIKQTLDSKGIPYKLSSGGTTISVPQKQVDSLKLDLAAQGIPQTGQIDYSIFSKNSNFGMTDNQFSVLQRAAMQTELSNLISGMSGVQSSKVMINLPDQSVWVSDKTQDASASIVLQLSPGYQLTDSQVTGLYNLVSKSVPNLPTSNIVIMDQNFNYYDQKNSNNSNSTLSVFDQQQQIKDQIEKDIRQKVQQMLGMMMGQDKVMVNVSTDIDFTQTKSKQKLVQPVDSQTMQGLVVSSENIQSTYSGGAGSNQTAGTGSSQVPSYTGTTSASGTGGSNSVDNKVNYVFNQITNDIQSSPYTLKDLGIQVMVEPPNPNKPSSLPKSSVNSIKQILNTIVQTSLDQGNGQTLTPQQIASKSVISVEKFNGKVTTPAVVKTAVPKWIWAVGAGGVLLVLGLLFLMLRRRKNNQDDVEEEVSFARQAQEARMNETLPTQKDTPEAIRKKQLENMAKENPQDFVKLLRSWISEE